MTADNDQLPQSLLQQIAQATDIHILSALAASPQTPSEVLLAIWHHPIVIVLREKVDEQIIYGDLPGELNDEHTLGMLEASIARHSNIPLELLTQLATQPKFGSLIAANPATPADVLESMVHAGVHYAATIHQIAHHPNTPATLLEKLVCSLPDSEFDAIRHHPNITPLALELIAYRQGHSDASPEVLEQLAHYGSGPVLIQVAKDANASASVLAQIFGRLRKHPWDKVILTLIANHPNTASETLQAISEMMVSWYQEMRQFKILSPSLDFAPLFAVLVNRAAALPEITISLDRLGEALPLFQMSKPEKLKLAADPTATLDQVALLAQEVSVDVLCILARNPATPLALLERLSEYRSEALEDDIARNPNASGELLRELYKRHRGRYFQNRHYFLFALHPNTPPDILVELAHSSDTVIRNALERNPAFRRD